MFVLFCGESTTLADKTIEDPDNPPCTEDDLRPSCLFDFDEEGQVKTESGEPERTFSLPPMKAGFIFDARAIDLTPSLSVELIDWEMFSEDFALDFGVAHSRIFVSFDWLFIPIFKAGPMVWAGMDIPGRTWAAGLGITFIKF